MGSGSAAGSSKYKQDDLGMFSAKYEVGAKIGGGAFGVVHLCEERASKTTLAVKTLRLQPTSICDNFTQCRVDGVKVLDKIDESFLWRLLGANENCVQLVDVFADAWRYRMVMERCRASLIDRLNCPLAGIVSDAEAAYMACQILRGVAHVHATGIVHRDVKPDNFLYGGIDGTTIKLADFGLAARLPASGKLKHACGTIEYMSPEMIGNTGYDDRTDIWAVGITCCRIFFGETPFWKFVGSKPRLKRAILSANPVCLSRIVSRRPSPLTEEASSFVGELLLYASGDRSSAEDALCLPFAMSGGIAGCQSHDASCVTAAPCVRQVVRSTAHGQCSALVYSPVQATIKLMSLKSMV